MTQIDSETMPVDIEHAATRKQTGELEQLSRVRARSSRYKKKKARELEQVELSER